MRKKTEFPNIYSFSLAYDTDYEYDEKEAYSLWWPYILRRLFTIIYLELKKVNDFI